MKSGWASQPLPCRVRFQRMRKSCSSRTTSQASGSFLALPAPAVAGDRAGAAGLVVPGLDEPPDLAGGVEDAEVVVVVQRGEVDVGGLADAEDVIDPGEVAVGARPYWTSTGRRAGTPCNIPRMLMSSSTSGQ